MTGMGGFLPVYFRAAVHYYRNFPSAVGSAKCGKVIFGAAEGWRLNYTDNGASQC